MVNNNLKYFIILYSNKEHIKMNKKLNQITTSIMTFPNCHYRYFSNHKFVFVLLLF